MPIARNGFAPYILLGGSLLPLVGCTRQAAPEHEAAVVNHIVSRDHLTNLATIVDAEPQLRDFADGLLKVSQDDYDGLKGSLIKATHGNKIPNVDDIHRIFEVLHLSTGEIDKERLEKLVHFLKESEARLVIERLYKDPDLKQLKISAGVYLKTSKGQEFIKALKKTGIEMETPLDEQLAIFGFAVLCIVAIPGGVWIAWRRRDAMALENRKPIHKSQGATGKLRSLFQPYR